MINKDDMAILDELLDFSIFFKTQSKKIQEERMEKIPKIRSFFEYNIIN